MESHPDGSAETSVDAVGTTGHEESGDRRGQTTLDFAIGISAFLVVVAFALAFTPGLLSPFTGEPVEETVAVGRIADGLALDLLGSPAEPHVLDPGCTAAFFDERSPDWCAFSGATLHDRVGASDRHFLNVTITGNVSDPPAGENLLCWDEGEKSLSELGSGDCGSATVLRSGSTPRSNRETTVARRVVTLNGTDATLEVKMW